MGLSFGLTLNFLIFVNFGSYRIPAKERLKPLKSRNSTQRRLSDGADFSNGRAGGSFQLCTSTASELRRMGGCIFRNKAIDN